MTSSSSSLAPDRVAALFRRHGESVRRLLKGVLGDPDRVEEALQRTFLKLLERGSEVDQAGYGGWLGRVAVLVRELQAASSVRDEVEVAYLAVLGRLPSEREVALWETELDRGGREVREDLVWTLANSLEFLFLR